MRGRPVPLFRPQEVGGGEGLRSQVVRGDGPLHVQACFRRVGDGEDDGQCSEGAGCEGGNIQHAGADVSKGEERSGEGKDDLLKIRVSTQGSFLYRKKGQVIVNLEKQQ